MRRKAQSLAPGELSEGFRNTVLRQSPMVEKIMADYEMAMGIS
jgi:hypothetical protein